MTEITVYTHSALGLGQEAAFEAHERALRAELSSRRGDDTLSDPCVPVGYVSKGSGPGSARRQLHRVRGPRACAAGASRPVPARAVRGEGELPPAGNQGRISPGLLLHARFLGLPERATIAQMAGAGRGVRRGVAVAGGGAPGGEQGGERGEDETFEEDESSLARYCFSSSLIVAAVARFETPGAGKDSVQQQRREKAVDWAMGAASRYRRGRRARGGLAVGIRQSMDGRVWRRRRLDWRILVLVFAVWFDFGFGVAAVAAREAVERRIRAKVRRGAAPGA